MLEILQYDFVRNALLAGLLISVACGIIGSLVVVNRMVFISGGIAHAAYGGIGLAIFLGISPIFGAGFFALVVALLIGVMTIKRKHRIDTVIGALWAAGMSLGIILMDISGGYSSDLMSYLFGSILSIPDVDLWAMLALDVIIILFTTVFYRELIAVSYDPEFASVRGVHVTLIHFFLLALTALTVVLTMRLVGLILVIALLTIPISICEEFSDTLGHMMVYSIIGSAITVFIGLWASYSLNLTSGASIILVATLFFFTFNVGKSLRVTLRHTRRP